MSLRNRPDFQDWLTHFEERHPVVRAGDERAPTAGEACEGCGEPLEAPVSTSGYCIVCLAETYGRERGQSVGRVSGMLEAALAQAGDVPFEDVRDAIEQVLERFEGGAAGPNR